MDETQLFFLLQIEQYIKSLLYTGKAQKALCANPRIVRSSLGQQPKHKRI